MIACYIYYVVHVYRYKISLYYFDESIIWCYALPNFSVLCYRLVVSETFFEVCLLCLCARLFICALLSPAGKEGPTCWLSFVVSNCEFITFPLVSWFICGT